MVLEQATLVRHSYLQPCATSCLPGIDVAVLDFSKAFDKVPHKHLLSKLQLYGIQGNVFEWIRAFLSNRTQRVLVEGVMSS